MERKAFSGVRVLVTGGSRGIGRETVRAFCRAGAEVAFLWNSSGSSADQVAYETGAYPIRCDVGDPDALLEAVKEAESTLSRIDVLVNNAGIAQTGLLQDLSLSDWNRLISVDLTAVYLASRFVIPGMVQRKSGRIVNISSVWGMVGASCEVAYSTVKAGVIGFTRALAKELGPSGITVNCVSPGVIDTDMMRAYDEETKRELANETPLGRLGTPADVAATILFLAGEGGSFMTGQVISPNGGFVI